MSEGEDPREARVPRLRPRRSLLLAGGGLKVAFQAGVMQVWLDEAGVEFDHVDACSGGAFNLAMLCQGLSGTDIADRWRHTHPAQGVSWRWRDLARVPWGQRSLVTMDAYRRTVFPAWGLDFDRIRASALNATFNAYDVSHGRLRVLRPSELGEDALCACVSLPIWFPPVPLDGVPHVDAVWVTDANVEAAIDDGADEIWVVWTVSTRGDWNGGLLAQFFQTLETSANGTFRRVVDRIAASNADLAAGRPSHYPRRIEMKILYAEVPVHYFVTLGADRLHRAVERGVATARAWCAERDVPTVPGGAATPEEHYADGVSMRFRDAMRGSLVPAAPAVPGGFVVDSPIVADLDLVVPDLGTFVSDPEHPVVVEGTVTSPLLGGRCEVRLGSAHLLVDDGDPSRLAMRYRLLLDSPDGRVLTLAGRKCVESGVLREAWRETTTLHTRVLEGDVGEDEAAPLVAAGVLRLGPRDVARQVATATVDAHGPLARARGAGRFAAMFAGHLWDVYARKVLAYGPF